MEAVNYKFHSDEIEALQKYRDNQPDARLKVRFISLLMLAQKVEMEIITSVIGKSQRTVENWLNQYMTKGVNSLNSFQYKPKQTFLKKEQIEELITWVKETNPTTTKEVKEYIKGQYKVIYCVEAVRQLLQKQGLKLIRPQTRPGDTPSEEDQKKIC